MSQIIKLTLEELNTAYKEAKFIGERSQRSTVKVVLARDPLVIHNISVLSSNSTDDVPLILNLDFTFDPYIGTKGRWVIDTTKREIEVIDLD